MSFAVFIESNTTGTGRLFAKRAGSLGYEPILLADEPARYPFVSQDHIRCIREDTADPDAIRHRLDGLAKEDPIAAIYSTSDYFVTMASQLAASRGLPAHDPNALGACRNKWLQLSALERCGVPIPKSGRAVDLAELDSALSKLVFPVVIKPASGSGSVGVRLCNDQSEAFEHGGFLLAQRSNERGIAVVPELIVQEYVTGPEYSVEIFGSKVLGITCKHLSDAPFFIEIGHDFPAEEKTQTLETMERIAVQAVIATGVAWGPAHVELRVACGGGPIVIEVNPRLAGGFIPELVRLATGVDVIAQTMKLVLGEPTDLNSIFSRHASIRFVTAFRKGRLRRITGLKEASSVPGVADVQLYRASGDVMGGNHDFRDRIGHVIASAESASAAKHAAESALELIAVESEPI
jgi:biotin carboxylase